MSKGRKTPRQIAYEALRSLMERPGIKAHAVHELARTLRHPSMAHIVPAAPQYDDRGVAIVFVSHLEEALEASIATHFVINPDESRRLFSYPDGPLAEFSAKIAMGYALGIYGKRMRDDLRWIKDIRNAFAHVRFEIDFETPEIKDAVNQLQLVDPTATRGEVTVPAGESRPLPAGETFTLSPRQQFTIVVTTLTGLLGLCGGTPCRLLGTELYPYPPEPTT